MTGKSKGLIKVAVTLLVLAAAVSLGAIPALAQDLVQFSGGIIVPGNQQVDSTVSILGPTRIDGEVLRGAVTILGPATINGRVGDGVVVVGGKANISGQVGGGLVVIGGSLRLTKTARIHGGMVVIGTSLVREPGAVVTGDVVNMTLKEALAGELGQWLKGYPLPGPFSMIFWWRLAGLLLLAVVLVIIGILFPGAVSRVSAELAGHPGTSLLWGVLLAFLAIPATILLFFTILGIPLALLLWLALACIYYLGMAGLSQLIGNRVLTTLGSRKPELYLATLVGVLITGVITWLPFIGLVVGMLLKASGVGAAVVTLVNRRR